MSGSCAQGAERAHSARGGERERARAGRGAGAALGRALPARAAPAAPPRRLPHAQGQGAAFALFSTPPLYCLTVSRFVLPHSHSQKEYNVYFSRINV